MYFRIKIKLLITLQTIRHFKNECSVLIWTAENNRMHRLLIIQPKSYKSTEREIEFKSCPKCLRRAGHMSLYWALSYTRLYTPKFTNRHASGVVSHKALRTPIQEVGVKYTYEAKYAGQNCSKWKAVRVSEANVYINLYHPLLCVDYYY